jgi:cytochrome c biogenesis protein CcmG/thiol:disulfide interchange protein DsbE
MEAVLRQYESRSLTILGVNNGENFERGRRYLDDLGISLTAFAYDPEAAIVRKYAVQGMPTSYFIDADGVITRVFAGAISQRVMQSAVEEAIIGWGKVQAQPR